MQITIDWDTLSVDQWHDYYKDVDKTNLIQSLPYASAIRATAYQSTRFGLIKHGGKAVGLAQVQEIKLFKWLHYVFLDRGPLWFNDDVEPALIEGFFKEFDRQFPRRFGRKRRVIPEIPQTPANEDMMAQLGYRKAGEGYHSVWVSLKGDDKQLRMNFKSKWRNSLKKAENSNLEIIGDTQGMMLKWFLQKYTQDRLKKKYPGPSSKLLNALWHSAKKNKQAMMLTAQSGNQLIASIMIFIHGSSATYQVGWAEDEGRQKNAHNLLLWKAMLLLRDRGIEWLDLGGLNEETAGGVTKFKRGFRGEEFQTVGIYK